MLVAVQSLSCVQLFATPWTATHQASLSFTVFRSLLKLMSIELVMPSNHLVLCCPLLLLPSVFVSIRVFFELTVHINCQSIGASASASALSMNIQGWFPLGLTGLFSCHLSNSEESSPAPQFESINSLVLSFLYGPTFPSIHDFWKNHSFD